MSSTPATAPAATSTEKKRALTPAEFLARMTGAAQERDKAQADLGKANGLLTACAAFLGLTLAELSTKKPDELTAALTAKAGTTQADANDKAVKAATDAKAAAEGKATNAEALSQVYVTGLAGAKVTVAAADTTKGVQASDVTQAINNRVNTLAGEKLAEFGFPEGGLPASGAGSDEPTDFAAQMKHYETLTGKERDEYYARVIGPALSGKS